MNQRKGEESTEAAEGHSASRRLEDGRRCGGRPLRAGAPIRREPPPKRKGGRCGGPPFSWSGGAPKGEGAEGSRRSEPGAFVLRPSTHDGRSRRRSLAEPRLHPHHGRSGQPGRARDGARGAEPSRRPARSSPGRARAPDAAADRGRDRRPVPARLRRSGRGRDRAGSGEAPPRAAGAPVRTHTAPRAASRACASWASHPD
jgi:hypothetical protein